MIEVIASVSFLAYMVAPEPQTQLTDKNQVLQKDFKETQKPKEGNNKRFGRPLV